MTTATPNKPQQHKGHDDHSSAAINHDSKHYDDTLAGDTNKDDNGSDANSYNGNTRHRSAASSDYATTTAVKESG
ncbi:hypothetical protein NQ176_g1353 [Zarea fungicola]|uniref:Uncharacterized protein n=1 Tax=Zarea fungicola TaxID=93591 RepID=A0ACC1NT69_9HYPO|nr:hypothetical protein NQ176_g1353 [Lecanicillium fungicola]